MSPNVPTWWTDDRVDETVSQEYIYSHLRPDERQLLKQSPSFGAGLTDDTYLDWVLNRAKRFFLILVDVGVPDQIFGIVDDSYDDDDLPISDDVVQDLRLSIDPNKSLDKRFYKTQFRYLIRVVGDGEHIRYAQEETVPVYPVSLKSTVISLPKDGMDKVRLPSDLTRILTRKRIAVDDKVTEHSVLSEIATAKHFAHQHVVSIFASYLFEDSVYVLFTPNAEYNLRSFLSDVPKVFDNLPKPERRRILIEWPHCLAHGLAWLHANGKPHASLRPSNIQIDDRFNICLGSFDGAGMVGSNTRVDDVEAYQYAAPERWKRAVTMQTTGPARLEGHSGGRTARKVRVNKDLPDSRRSSWTTDTRLETATPTAIGYAFMPTAKANFTRLQLGKTSADSVLSLATQRSVETRQSDHASIGTARRAQRTGRSDTPSGNSMASTGSNRTVKAALMNPIFVASPDVRTAVVQTWQSAQFDLFAADVFSLGAIILDILTLLCKRSASSFVKHRGSKNRTPGRGGGLADASFHANVTQVILWANVLQEDAKKRAKKADGDVFRAVGPIIQLIKRCLDREPEERLGARELEKRMEEHILTSAGIGELHCRRELSGDGKSPTIERAKAKPLPDPPLSPPSTLSDKFESEPISYVQPREDEWSKLRSKGLVTATIPSPGPESSFSSMSSFNFDYDINSVTIVEDDRSHVTTEPSEGRPSRPVTADSRDLMKRMKAKSKKTETWNNWHNNDSAVDPSLSVTQSPSSEHGGFNYVHNGNASSDDENYHQQSFLLPATRPSSIFPEGEFPAVPVRKTGRYKTGQTQSGAVYPASASPPPTRSLPQRPVQPQEAAYAPRSIPPQPPRPGGNDELQDNAGLTKSISKFSISS